MNAIAEALAGVQMGAAQSYKNLWTIPLVAAMDMPADYLTLDEALEQGARVREVTEGGSVPELKFENDTAHKVLLLDGEELVGARQNRVLNLTLLVSVGQHLVIPVSCVERGRWSYRTPEFSSSARHLYARGKSSKQRQVSASLRREGSRRSDQTAVWEEIDSKFGSLDASSATSAMGDIYEQQKSALDDYSQHIPSVARQVGALYAVNGRIVGLELFDSPATFKKAHVKLITSYAMDALEQDQATVPAINAAAVEAFFADLKNSTETVYPSLGEGIDVRLQHVDLSAAALVTEGRVIHLAAYRIAA